MVNGMEANDIGNTLPLDPSRPIFLLISFDYTSSLIKFNTVAVEIRVLLLSRYA